ncbi:hypothetical protein V8F20_001385 [Naviculisporaceae sp. PSN 640]
MAPSERPNRNRKITQPLEETWYRNGCLCLSESEERQDTLEHRKLDIRPSQKNAERPKLSYDDLKWARMHGLTEEDVLNDFDCSKMAILNGRNPFRGKPFERLIRALHGDSAKQVLAQFARESHNVARVSSKTPQTSVVEAAVWGSRCLSSDFTAQSSIQQNKRRLSGTEPPSPRKRQKTASNSFKGVNSSVKTPRVPSPRKGKKRPLQGVEETFSPRKKRARLIDFDDEDI